MNTLIIRCMLVCTILWSTTPFAAQSGDTTKTSTKEIIIVNYDQLSSASLTELAIYASEIWLASSGCLMTITEYVNVDDAAMASEISDILITSLLELGVNKDNITLQKANNQRSSAYFSISIAGDASIQ